MLGTEEEKLFDAPLSISKREELERQVGVGVPDRTAGVAGRCGVPGQAGSISPVPQRAPLSL